VTTKKLYIPALFLLTLSCSRVHPFGQVRDQHAQTLFAGVRWENTRALTLFERSCQNCHSQRTQWPAYTYLPVIGWAIEKDVSEARKHMDFSQWDQYSSDEQRDLLARIGTVVKTRQMPMSRYLLLHPEARLSDADIQIIYEWTKAQRKVLRNQE
jgi:cytochrome c